MTNADHQLENDHPNWKTLAEFMIPSPPGIETQVLEHFADTLNQFDLDPQQMDRIMSAIGESLQNMEGSQEPLHLRISVSGFDRNVMPPLEDIDNQQDSWPSESGLGFFIVERVVGQLQDPDPAKYKLLEVLIYRESSEVEGQ